MGTQLMMKSSVDDLLLVLKTIQEKSGFSLKPARLTEKKDTNKYAISFEHSSTGKATSCGTLELIEQGNNKTVMKFSREVAGNPTNLAEGKTFDRFFFIMMQQLIQCGILKFEK